MRTEPSAASIGEAFTTSDGWSITVETFALQVAVSAQPADESLGTLGGGYILFNGKRQEDLVVVGVPHGPALGLISLIWSSRHRDGTYLADDNRDLPPDIVERFVQQPSGDFDSDPSFVIGPSLIVVAHAQKGARSVLFDVALRGDLDPHVVPVVIVANALTPAIVPLAVEALFTNAEGAIVFDDIAAAAKNEDGVLAPEELRRAQGSCSGCDPWPFADAGTVWPSVLDALQERTTRVIGLPRQSLPSR